MAGNRGKQIKTSAEETKEENIEWNKRFLVNIKKVSKNFSKSFIIIVLVI